MEKVASFKLPIVRINPGASFIYLIIFLSGFGVYAVELGNVGLTPINLLVILALPIVILIACVRQQVPQISIIGALYFIFFLICMFGAVVADSPIDALRGAGGYFLENMLCFFYVIFFLKTRQHVEKAIKFFILGGIFNCVMGLTQLIGYYFFNEMIFPPLKELFRGQSGMKAFGYGTGAFSIPGFAYMTGFIGDGFGPWLIIPFSLSIYGIYKYKTLKFMFITSLFFVTIVLSVSRSSYLGLGAFLSFIYIFYRSKDRRFFPLVFNFYKTSFIVLFIIIGLYVSNTSSFFDRSEIKLSETTTIKTPIHLIKRVNPFIESMRSIQIEFFSSHMKLAMIHGFDNLGFGRGSENFDDFVYKRYPVKYGSHSNFIIFLGDTGIWGFLTQILIVIFTIGYGLRTYFRQPKDTIDHLPLFLTGIYLALVMTGIVRTFYLTPSTFIITGLIIKLNSIQYQEYDLVQIKI